MNKTKKILIVLMFFGIFIILGNTKSNAGSLYLNNLDFDVQINQDGSMNVTETWDISVEETNTLFKTFKTDSSKYSSISNVQVVEIADGTKKNFSQVNSIMYHVTKDCYYGLKNSQGNFEIAWGVGMDNTRGTKKYQISYKVNDVIAKYQDYAELYWQFIGSDFRINCNKITGKILLPRNATSTDEIKVWGHTEGLNGEIYATSTNTIEFELNRFYSGRYVEVRTLFPTEMISSARRIYSKNILDEVISEETVWADEANARREKAENSRKMISAIFVVSVAIIDVLLIRGSMKIFKEASEKTKIMPSMEIEYYRELPRKNATPAQAVYEQGEILSSVSTNQMGNIFSATLLDLSLKKYIEFAENPGDKKNIIINILKKGQDSDLEKTEKIVFRYILRASKDDTQVTIKEIEKYMKKHSSGLIGLKDDIESSTIDELKKNKLYDEKGAEEKRNFSLKVTMNMSLVLIEIFIGISLTAMLSYSVNEPILMVGIISVIALTILRTIALMKYNKKITVYTQSGVDEKQMWIGLKKYMEDFSMLNEREIPEIAIWEHFLVYATAFGIADKVIKQLKAVYKQLGRSFEFDESYGYMYFMTNNNFSSSFTNSMSSAFSSAYSSNYSSSYSSGFGGGGGFSGGGGGGRWPEVAAAVDNWGTLGTLGPILFG